MKVELSVWFGQDVLARFAPPIQHYADILLNKIGPIFDDVDGEQQRAAAEVLSSPVWNEDNYEAGMETAYERGIAHAIQFMEMRSVFLAVGVSGLYHMFEKHLYGHLNHELRDWLKEPISDWTSAADVINKLTNRYDKRGDPRQLVENFQNKDLKELRLVANAVKHGEGRSYTDLKSMSAMVVDPARLVNDWTVGVHSTLAVPLSIEASDVVRYRDVVMNFWITDGHYWAKRSSFK